MSLPSHTCSVHMYCTTPYMNVRTAQQYYTYSLLLPHPVCRYTRALGRVGKLREGGERGRDGERVDRGRGNGSRLKAHGSWLKAQG